MIAEIISIGSELLRGELTDTNSSWLASQLITSGLDISLITQAGDNRERLADTLRRAWDRSDLVIATGGLGPTADDLTRESIAELLGESLRVDPTLESHLRDMFARFGRPMPDSNLKQAALIPSAQAIPNPLGTAPGWWIERERKMLAALPGPPREMQHMWKTQVAPRIARRLSGTVIRCRTLKILGYSEAAIDEMLGALPAMSPVETGIYAKSDGIHIRLIARDPSEEIAAQNIRAAEQALRGIFLHHLWGTDDDTLAGTIAQLLLTRGKTLATMESFTGGLLASSLGSTAESMNCYRGGIVLGSPGLSDHPSSLAGTLHNAGQPSVDTACSMADAARRHMAADIGIGIAGPPPASSDSAVVAIAVADGDTRRTRENRWPLSRFEVRQWIAVSALFELILFLADT